MDYKRVNDKIIVRIDRGEEVLSTLTKLAEAEHIEAATAYGLGACDRIEVGLYSVAEKIYHKNIFEEEMEISSLIGSFSRKDGAPYLHFHINCARKDSSVVGGHLNECRISGTCELRIDLFDAPIGRQYDNETGLNIYKF